MPWIYGIVYLSLCSNKLRDMNQTITILEALVIGVATLLVYTFVKTVYEHYFKTSK
jgi:hypothetical protein